MCVVGKRYPACPCTPQKYGIKGRHLSSVKKVSVHTRAKKTGRRATKDQKNLHHIMWSYNIMYLFIILGCVRKKCFFVMDPTFTGICMRQVYSFRGSNSFYTRVLHYDHLLGTKKN